MTTVSRMQAPGFYGIDLAWSDRARTGLAIVDASGRLLDSTSLISDDEIDTWLAGSGLSPVVIALDAPMIVKNPAGQRPCERELSREYGRFNASCHTSNLARPWFNPTRGSVLASRHGWIMDPQHVGTTDDPAAIEVYPHPAMVSLFSLERIIPYKAKRGRTVDARRAEFLRLLAHIERDLPALALPSSQRWSWLRDAGRGGCSSGRPEPPRGRDRRHRLRSPRVVVERGPSDHAGLRGPVDRVHRDASTSRAVAAVDGGRAPAAALSRSGCLCFRQRRWDTSLIANGRTSAWWGR